ncbi:ATP-binding protein, partial [Zavarzinella formosa]
MELGPIRVLLGPNRWSQRPVVAGELTSLPETASAVLDAARDFQHMIDFHGSVAIAAPSGRPGVFHIVLDFDEPSLGEGCLRAGFDRTAAAQAGQPFDADQQATKLRALAFQTRLGPSTRSIAEAARRRGIPIRRLTAGSLLQLGWGEKLKRIWTAETDDTPIVAEAIAQDKQLTRTVLTGVGVPVPQGRVVIDADDAWAAAEELGVPVVVKPRNGNQGRGVFTCLTTREQITAAYSEAAREGQGVLVETHAPGQDHRLLVIGGRLVAAAIREPAQVVGDG